MASLIALGAFAIIGSNLAEPKDMHMPDEKELDAHALDMTEKYHGELAHIFPRTLDRYEMHVQKPLPRFTTLGDGDGYSAGSGVDPIAAIREESAALRKFDWERTRYRFQQQQGMNISKRIRGFADPLTREIHHPNTGESSNFIRYAFLPKHPTQAQVNQSLAQVEMFPEELVRYARGGGDKFYTAPGVTWRHDVDQKG